MACWHTRAPYKCLTWPTYADPRRYAVHAHHTSLQRYNVHQICFYLLIDHYANPRYKVHTHFLLFTHIFIAQSTVPLTQGVKMLNFYVTSVGTSLTVGTLKFYSFQMGPLRCYSSDWTSLTVLLWWSPDSSQEECRNILGAMLQMGEVSHPAQAS